MTEPCGDLAQCIHSAAGLAIQRCARGLLTVETLSARVREEWEALSLQEDQTSQQLLNRIALRYCSRLLYQACCSPHEEIQNCGFENLRRYLAKSLQNSPYAPQLMQHEDAAEDVLQMTLEIAQKACASHPPGGPDDPAAFLKWSLTILNRQAYAFVAKAEQESVISLDAQYEVYIEGLEDRCNTNSPEAKFDLQELQQTLSNAMLSLSSKRYRQVLSGTYLAGMDERELATLLGVQVQEVYLWRHRALKALRRNRKVLEALRPWLR
ncbi:MAG TPA: sigma-70 family RNA polymerase sigma factor [Ktedonobacteraceae bacterium]|nr:sigma-70 family RNA polymerase sigma factor [Ktedonobacteraceae bacterium]